ncbi:ATP-binding protein [Roseateles sp. BYS87W]|uniref:histidine kinase n=1 Tax=Pelomonas baiyunensis TaxID=3299026 RepID=A0ABW7GUQ7_9BURK
MPVTIRSRLLLLVLSALLPCMLGVAWLIGSTYEAERVAHSRTLRDTSRALSMLVDGELQRRAAIAHVLAQSPELDGSLPLDAERRLGFDQLARRAMQGLEGWVELRAPGEVLISTRQPEGQTTSTPGPAQLQAQPVMLPLGLDPRWEAHAAWVEPVMRQDRLAYNIVVTVKPAELQRIVDAMAPPPGWFGTVLDATGHLVARRPGGAQFVGRLATPVILERLKQAREGEFESISLDGMQTVGYFSTSATGWTYVSAMPRAAYAGRMPQAVQRLVVGALALLALALLGAMWVARRIETPVRALEGLAQDLQAARPVQAQATGLVEADGVAVALADAGRSLAQARDELERSVAEAVARTRQVEQRVAQEQRVMALGRLTGGVAHEFNNLLGIISNSRHLIARQAAGSTLERALGAIQRSVDRGSQLTQHLLRFSGQHPALAQAVQLDRYLPEVQGLMRSVLSRTIDIRVEVTPDLPAVQVDASELDLALVNLALNAHDALPDGGALHLLARLATADEAADLAPGTYVLLAVSDDGRGLDAAQVEHAFEPFFTTKQVGQGTGLGLSQVHGFATQAGGTARLASTPGLGTTVSLLLPVVPPAASPVHSASAVHLHDGAAAGTGPIETLNGTHVLLVEDDASLAEVTAALLSAHGARVHRAAGADQALEQMERLPQVDVVLTDVVMPGRLDGVALARQLRAQHPALAVVLISGFNLADVSPGEFTQLRKPCAPHDLLAALRVAARGPAAGESAGQTPGQSSGQSAGASSGDAASPA